MIMGKFSAQKKKGIGKRWIFWLLLTALLLGVAYASYRLVDRWMEYRREDESYAAVQAHVQHTNTVEHVTPVGAADEEEEATVPIEALYDFPVVDFAALYAVNPEIIGWIYLPNSTINYPIAKHDDNVYYLDHMFDKKGNGSGSIYMDCDNRADFRDDNTILYGHNMRNNTMFSALTQYKEPGYYEGHPVILIMTPIKNYVMKVFAAESTPSSNDSWLINFDSPESRQQWIDARIAASVVDTGVEPGPDDRLMTLSTCISDRNGNRFLVHGFLQS